MVFIPPPHLLQGKGDQKEQSPRELASGMFVVFLLMLGIALFIFILGPRSNNPPPLTVGYAVSGLALIFGLVAFFAWMKAQSEDDAPSEHDSHSDRES